LTYRGGICLDYSYTVLEDRGSFENIKVNNLSSININSLIVNPNLEIVPLINLIPVRVLYPRKSSEKIL
jgi:hypothetical protein